MNKDFEIGGLKLRFCSDTPIGTGTLFAPYITEFATPDVTVRVKTGPLPEIETGSYTTYPYRGAERPYACRVKTAADAYDLYIDHPEGMWDAMIFLAMYFAALLPDYGRIMCHCSYILREGEAVLFVGHKQVGKSTQAALWEQFGHAEIINGDRAVFMLDGQGHLVACGTPYCGSSRIAVNKTAPVKALVFLAKGSENTVIRIDNNTERLRTLMPHLHFDSRHADSILTMAQAICTAVPFYSFSCRPDRDAVAVMEQELWK